MHETLYRHVTRTLKFESRDLVRGSGCWVQGCGGSFAAKYIFAAEPPPPFLISNFAFLIRAKLSFIISGRAALRANPEPRTLNQTTSPLFPLYSMLYCAKMGLEIIQCMNMRVII